MSEQQLDIAEVICESVNILIEEKIKGIQFDRTINCTIINDEQAKDGVYRVSDGSTKFYAYSASTTYKKDDAVYVTVPNGDFNNQKIIIGKQVTNNTSPFLFTTPFDTMVDVSTNLINDKVTEGYLRANDPEEKEVLLWEKDFTANNQEIVGYTRLGLQGQFRSWLDSFKCINGDYGYKLILHCKEEVVKTEENNYDLAIKALTGVDTISLELMSYLQNTLGLTIDWDKYRQGGWFEFDPETGESRPAPDKYNITQLIADLEENRVELSYAKYDLYLSSSRDMYGNPYNFETFYQQEKVFDISSIKQIEKMELYFYQQPLSFIDKNGNQVPYLDDFDNPLLPNLFTKDVYICLGYDVASFNEDQADIYCLDSKTYSDHYLLEDNKKYIVLRWVHKFEDGRIKTVPNTSDLEYEIRWYRYKLGAPSADEYSGVYWERIEGDGFYQDFLPNVKKEQEQIKAIILFNDKVIRSNILIFENEKEVINEATSNFLQGLNIWCKDNTYGNYYIYDPGNKMLEQYDVKQARELVALFSTKSGLTTSEQEGSILTEATRITWTFPTVSTMLEVYNIDYSVPYPNKDAENPILVCAPRGMTAAQGYATFKDANLHTLSYELNDADKTEVVYDHIAKTIEITRYGDINNAEAINPHQLYFIKTDYIQSYANNVIQCSIKKNHTDYFTSKTFYFGQAGTTGTDVTLKIYIDPADTFALTKYADKGDTLHCRALLFDSHNKEVDPNNNTEYANVKYEWSWFDYKYDDNNANDRYISTSIQPYIGSLTDKVTEEVANQIIKNKQWLYSTQDKKWILDNLTTYYKNACRNEVIISADTKLNMNHFLILQCTVKGWGDYDLTAYKPIAIRNGETYSYVDCANEVIYLTSGYPEYYKEKWKIHFENIDNDNDGYEDEDNEGYWKIFNPHDENLNFIGSFKENVLNPIGIYIHDAHQYGAQYVSNSSNGKQEAIKILEKIDRRASFIDTETQQKINNLTGLTIQWLEFKNGEMTGGDHENGITATIKYITYDIDKLITYINENATDSAEIVVWTQPIVCLTNNYPSGTLNKWTGKEIDINDEGGYILSPAIATGKKNSDNTFSGIMLGDWSHDKITSGENPFLTRQTGVYGFHHGMLSYALMEDGTAFFGKSGEGRIMFDGTESTISNYGYRLEDAGMMIDLDNAFIDFQDDTQRRVYISKDGTATSPFFEIKGDNQDLVHISTGINGQFYLQTDDYESGTSGVRIDLKDGHIDAYNFKIEASGTGGTLTIDSSAEYYPFDVNDHFKIGWDGGIISTWGNIGGFYISDHAIFGGPLTALKEGEPNANWANGITVFGARTYWGETSAGAGTYDFRLGNSLIYRGDQSGTNSIGRMYLASNLYSFKSGDTDITKAKDLQSESYFLFGINTSNNLQIGTVSTTADYEDVNIYGGKLGTKTNADGDTETVKPCIRLIPNSANKAAGYSLRITEDELRVKGIDADNQWGIYARFA